MNRRSFMKSSAALAGATALTSPLPGGAAENSLTPSRQLIEIRRYQLRRGPMQKRFDDFYRAAAIPAMNRAGIATVGVFGVSIGPDNPTMYALLAHNSLESFAASFEKVRDDEEFQKAGAEFLNVPPTDPSYIRVESTLLIGFETMPKVEVPAQTAAKKPRIFEMRTYEAHSKKANKKKIEMFDRGEIAIFRKNGLIPVFFGETLIGPKQPNLTYMLVYDGMAARDENWGKFIADPDWKKLSTTPGYTDPEILTNITSVFLRPTAYSQI
jgi:hypothetical protein